MAKEKQLNYKITFTKIKLNYPNLLLFIPCCQHLLSQVFFLIRPINRKWLEINKLIHIPPISLTPGDWRYPSPLGNMSIVGATDKMPIYNQQPPPSLHTSTNLYRVQFSVTWRTKFRRFFCMNFEYVVCGFWPAQ